MNIIPVFPLDITATTTAGYLARREQRFAIDENTIEWLFACRTGVPEITNVIQLVCKYIFNGTIEVNGQPGHVLHKVCNFRSTGEAILEQLLVYSFCFISFNPTTSEPVVWDLHDLTVQMERSMYGEITMYARPRSSRVQNRWRLDVPLVFGAMHWLLHHQMPVYRAPPPRSTCCLVRKTKLDWSHGVGLRNRLGWKAVVEQCKASIR